MGYLRITSVRVQKCEENVKRLKKRVIKFFTLQEANKYYEKRKKKRKLSCNSQVLCAKCVV